MRPPTVLRSRARRVTGHIVHRILVIAGAVALTVGLFLVLPLLQAINAQPPESLSLQDVDTSTLPPPPPPPPEKKEEEPEEKPEETPPKLSEESVPLNLSQLELALDPGVGGAFMEGDFAVKLGTVGGGGGGGNVDSLFSLGDLDQKPRVVHQPSPVLSADLKKKTPGSVTIVFVVNQDGRVETPLVQDSSDPAFERPAVSAVRQWRFEPGKRNGQPVRFRMRVPIVFPQG